MCTLSLLLGDDLDGAEDAAAGDGVEGRVRAAGISDIAFGGGWELFTSRWKPVLAMDTPSGAGVRVQRSDAVRLPSLPPCGVSPQNKQNKQIREDNENEVK